MPWLCNSKGTGLWSIWVSVVGEKGWLPRLWRVCMNKMKIIIELAVHVVRDWGILVVTSLPLIQEAAFFFGWGVICRNPWFMMINCHGTRLIARKQLTSPSLSPQEIWPCHKSHRKCASRIQETQQRTQLWGRKLMTRHTNPSCSYHSQILTNPQWGGGGIFIVKCTVFHWLN